MAAIEMATRGSVRVARSALHGRGVFARRALRAGQRVARLHGRVVDAARVSPYGYQLWKDTYLEPTGPLRFLNHRCRPNCRVNARLELRTLRAVDPGEELTIDYASVVAWRPWRMECHERVPGCRRLIRPWRHLPPRLKRRYGRPLFAWIEDRGRVPSGLPPLIRAAARQRLPERRHGGRSDRL